MQPGNKCTGGTSGRARLTIEWYIPPTKLGVNYGKAWTEANPLTQSATRHFIYQSVPNGTARILEIGMMPMLKIIVVGPPTPS
jgi:hypothetical protein